MTYVNPTITFEEVAIVNQQNAALSRKEFAPVKMFSHEAIGSLTKV